jgi:hypothetical protein
MLLGIEARVTQTEGPIDLQGWWTTEIAADTRTYVAPPLVMKFLPNVRKLSLNLHTSTFKQRLIRLYTNAFHGLIKMHYEFNQFLM